MTVEEAIRSNRWLAALEVGRVPEEELRAFAGEQHAIVSSDRRSFEHLAARFPEEPARSLFRDLAAGEEAALGQLAAFGRSLGVDEAWLEAYEPRPGCQAYPAFVAWLALNGSPGDVAEAFLANLAAWGECCGRIADALRDRHDVAFFEAFAAPSPELERRVRALAEDTPSARRAARLLQAYELLYWETLADALQ